MCFHNSMTKKTIELADRYKRKWDILKIAQDIVEEKYHVSAFTFPDYPVITKSEEVQVYKWGLIPFWTPTKTEAQEIRKMTLNAKAETLFKKPSFREPIKTKRCIIPSTGFFDWRHENEKKIPYFIYVKDEPIFSMAGIYDVWEDSESGILWHTFSIITTMANSLMRYIHNTNMRMPAILSYQDEEKWLDSHLDETQIKAFLKPYSSSKMDAYRIEPDFLKKSPDDKSIIQPLEIHV